MDEGAREVTTGARSCPACATPLPEAAQFCMHCGTATPTDPGVPPRTTTTGAVEVAQVTQALAGRYRIESVVGEGGMATVYLAEDLRHKRKVAVKVMRPELAATLGADRFLREVEIAAKLQHPHILPLYDSGESNGMLFYVMPLVEGESLKDRLAREGALPPDEALKLGREIAEALAYAHKRGIVHRDIKPANILLSEGHAYIADFGIARAVGDGGTEALTKTGLAVGTPQYMAPEQATGEKEVDGRADVYATGAILYEMLTGQPPFTGQNARAVLTRSLTEAPKPVHAVNPALTPAVDAVVQKALMKAAGDRFASAEQLALAIDGIRARTSGTMPAITSGELAATQVTPTAAPSGGRPAWLAPRNLALAALAIAALAFVLARRGGGGSAAPTSVRSNRIAVLPFRNEASPADAYLVQGLVDDVRERLARVASLTVIGSASSSEYEDTRKSFVEIGRELDTDVLLTGRVRWSGEGASRRLVMEPSLVDARSGKPGWGNAYERDQAGLPGLPADVAFAVATAAGVTLSPADSGAIGARSTGTVEAYRAYLRGRAILGSSPPVLRSQIQEFEQAVALDSTFVQAWAALTNATGLLFSNGDRDAAAARRSRDAMDRVVALAPGTAMARRARSNHLDLVEGNASAARTEIDLALRAAPNDISLLNLSGSLDMFSGDLGSALAKLERAQELDPRSPAVLGSLAQVYTHLGRPKEAQRVGATLLAIRPMDLNSIQQLAIAHLADGDVAGARRVLADAIERGVTAPSLAVQMTGYFEVGFALEESQQQLVLRLTPDSFDGDRAWWAQSLATLHWQRGDTARARAYADSAIAPTRAQMAGAPGNAQLHGLLALMYAYLGRAAEARAEIEAVLDAKAGGTQQAYNWLSVAKAELALGDRDAAVRMLERVRASGWYTSDQFLALDPTYASLKGHPSFEAMLAKP
jgi:serine/threonine-protein kinase